MKKAKNQLVRMQNMLETDRDNNQENFKELLLIDVEKVLKDYFDYSGSPTITTQKNSGDFLVKIELKAERIKNFIVIPK